MGALSRVPDELTAARARCRDAEAVVIAAGAGMGVDSGLPDFRGNEGFWKAYPPYRKLGFSFMEMASPARFGEAPAMGWGFYGHRLQLYRDTPPHDGFGKLLEYGHSRRRGFFVFTSNVDGHFQAAGFPDDQIVECHGSIRHLQCFQSCRDQIWSAEGTEVRIDPDTMRAREPLPRCWDCGGLARPNILMFGDWGWNSRRTLAQESRLQTWLKTLGMSSLVILEFGAGTAVPTVRHFSEQLSRTPGSCVIRVNPGEPEIHQPGISLPMGANEAIDALLS